MCNKICKNSVCKDCEIILKEKFNLNKITYNNKEFDEHIFFSKYEGVLREKILSYKFNNKAYLYKFFLEMIIKSEKEYRFFNKYDIIVPVPIHKKRKLVRGYNQSELIAKNIAKNYKDLTYMNILSKTKNTVPQSLLNKNQRKKNIKNAYKLKDISLKHTKIILFDDIYTTGATANECSKLLKQAGANKVTVVTIAKD